jgi:hypothetical protein
MLYLAMSVRPISPEAISTDITGVISSNLADGHECHLNKCKIENLPVQIHKYNDRYYIVCPYIQPVNGLSPVTLHEKIYSMYICKDTGKIHHCHSNCDGDRMTNIHDCKVCCISGLQYESETVRSWQENGRCTVSITGDKSDPLKFSREKDGRVKSSGAHNLKTTQNEILARSLITSFLFSSKRYTSEWNKYNEMLRDADKTVNKYRRMCEKKKKTKYHIHMATIWYRQMKRRQLHTELIRRTEEEKKEIIERYTQELIVYQNLVADNTIMGKESPSQFNFKTFAPACLYLMKNGLEMGGHVIIRRSKYLDCALPETNTLDLYNIHKPTFTASKNNILKAIRESVEKGVQTPESLSKICKASIKAW